MKFVVDKDEFVDKVADFYFPGSVGARKLLDQMCKDSGKELTTCAKCKHHFKTDDGWHLCDLHYKNISMNSYCSEAELED